MNVQIQNPTNWRIPNMHDSERERVLCDMDIADFASVGFISLDMDATVRIPEAYGTVFAAT